MAGTRQVTTLTIQLVHEGDGPLTQLRIAYAGGESYQAVNLDLNPGVATAAIADHVERFLAIGLDR